MKPCAARRVFLLGFVLLAILAPTARSEERLTLGDIKNLLELKVPESEIILAVKKAKIVEVEESDFDKLRGWGASEAMIKAIDGKLADRTRDVLQVVIDMKKGGATKQQLLDYITRRGKRIKLSTSDMLKLSRLGIDNEVIKAIQHGWIPPGYRRSEDSLRFLSMCCPSDWNTYEWFQDGKRWILLSPEKGVKGPNKFRTGVQVLLSTFQPSPRYKRAGILEYHRRRLPSLIRGNRSFGFKVAPGAKGKPVKATLAGHDAVRQQFLSKMLGTACRENYVRCVAHGFEFMFEFIAPEAEFAKLEPVFERMLATAKPFANRETLIRRDSPMNRGDVLARYRESVVMVRAYFGNAVGTGTGFFVREDGLLLTNHHVVYNRGKPATRLEVVWDSAVGPKRPGQSNRVMPAKLLDAVNLYSPLTDLALVQVNRGPTPYKPIPLCTIESGLVEAEDEVIALGFPVPSSMREVGRLFPTNGHVSRVNHLPGYGTEEPTPDRLDDIVLDITINKGNSGGPCVSLRTGGVIGLNTQIVLAHAVSGQLQKLEYGRVCLIDHALKQFPALLWYPRNGRIGPKERTELATLLIDAGNLRPAQLELSKALKNQRQLTAEQRAHLRYQWYRYHAANADWDRAYPHLDLALKEYPDHVGSLIDAVYWYSSQSRTAKLNECLDRLKRVHGDWYTVHSHEAEIHRRAGRYPKALEAIKQSMDRGGGFDPAIVRGKAQILWDMGKFEEAGKTFRRALEVEPGDYLSRIALAKLHTARKDMPAAHSEFARALREFPEEAQVHTEYGLFLNKHTKRVDDALVHLIKAAKFERLVSGRPSPTVFKWMCKIGSASKHQQHVSLALVSGAELHRLWPSQRSSAHQWLRKCWKRLGRPQIARAHVHADPDGNATGSFPVLDLADLDALVARNYHYGLLAETLKPSSINVNAKALLQHIQKRTQEQRMPESVSSLLLVELLDDQTKGATALGRELVSLNMAKGVTAWGRGTLAPYIAFRAKNTGNVPLNGIRLRLWYQGKDGKTIWTDTKAMSATFEPLLAGQEKTGLFYFHLWKTLARHGVTRENLSRISWRGEFARNAALTFQVPAGMTTDTKGCYVTIENKTFFALKKVRLRCEFLGANGQPLRNPARYNMPIFDQASFDGLTIPRGRKSKVLSVARWQNHKYLQFLGVSAAALRQGVKMRVTVVEVEPIVR